jgi:hypothetical protein
MDQRVVPILLPLVGQIIIYLAGAVLASRLWKKYPVASNCFFVAMAFLLISALGSFYQFYWLPAVTSENTSSLVYLGMASLLYKFLDLSAFVLLIVAVFAGRTRIVLSGDSNPLNLTPIYNPLLGRSISILGYLLFLAGIVMIAMSQKVSPLLCGSLGAVVMSLAVSTVMVGKRYRATSAQKKLAQDQRPPVLYLRRFDDDEGSLSLWSRRYTTHEQRLIAILESIGPVIALGRPGEMLPPLGAARMYLSHDSWQATVIELLRTCSAVVIQAAPSPSILWEIEQVTQHVTPERVLIALPVVAHDKLTDKQRYEEFRNLVNPSLPVALPNMVGYGRYLRFSDNWRPIWLHSADMTAWVLSLSKAAKRDAAAADSLPEGKAQRG